MKVSKNFRSEELLPKIVHDTDPALVFRLMDFRIVQTMQDIRDHFDIPFIINNWNFGGKRQWSGYRPYNYYLGKVRNNEVVKSQHHNGRAIDAMPVGGNIDEIRKEIIRKWDKLFPMIGAIEMGVSWLHIDCRYRPDGSLLLFNP